MNNVCIPGFVDLQVNGFCGVDFSSIDLTEESFKKACRKLLREGNAAFLATVITSPIEVYRHNLPLMAKIMNKSEFKGCVLGFHIEGPFISKEPGARGVHNPDWILEPDIALFDQLQQLADGKMKILTIAADIKGAEELASHVYEQKVTVSLGHQMALEEDINRLIKAGATALTHLGNAVPMLLPRHNNPIWAGLAADELTALIISDGHHLTKSMLKTFIRAKSAKKLIVTSDVSPVAGLKPGTYDSMGGKVTLEKSGLLYNKQTGLLAGSSSTLLKCMNMLASLNLLELDDLINVGFYNPLQLIGVDPRIISSAISLYFDNDKSLFYLN